MGRALLLCALAALAPWACFSTRDEGLHGPQIKHVFLVRRGSLAPWHSVLLLVFNQLQRSHLSLFIWVSGGLLHTLCMLLVYRACVLT